MMQDEADGNLSSGSETLSLLSEHILPHHTNEVVVAQNAASKRSMYCGSGDGVSIRTKLGYGYGGIGSYVYSLIMGFFINSFLLQVAHLDPVHAGTITATTQLWGAFTNPIVGYLSDRSPYPRRMSWIGWTIVPFSYFYFLGWLVPPLPYSGLVAYYFIVYTLLATSYVTGAVPYNSLTAEITQNYDSRTILSTYRWMMSLALGTLSAVVQSVLLFSFPEGNGEYNLQKGYMLAGAVIALFLLTPPLAVILMVKEVPSYSVRKGNLLSGFKLLVSNRQFLIVIIINSCCWFALTLLTANLLLYMTYVVNLEELFPIVLVLVLVACTIFLPLWAFLAMRFGKKNIYFVGTALLGSALLLCSILPEGAIAMVIVLPTIGGIGLGVLYLSPYSMIPDVVELDQMQTGGERREGLFYSIYILFERFSTAMASFLVGILLQYSGYSSDPNSLEVQRMLRFIVGILPPAALLLSWIPCIFYNISKKRHAEIVEVVTRMGDTQYETPNSTPVRVPTFASGEL